MADALPVDRISDFVDNFRKEQDKYCIIRDRLGLVCSDILSKKNVKFHWEARVKSPDSLETKLRQRSKDYGSDDANCKAIKDLVAGRVILPRWSNFSIVENMIEEHFDIVSRTQHPKPPRKNTGTGTMQQRFRDYDGFHFYFKRRPETVTDGLQDVKIEIQVMSPFMWAYQDLEHDVEYKQLSGTPSQEETRALEYVRGIANLGEVAIQHFEDAAFARQNTASPSTITISTEKNGNRSVDQGFPLLENSLQSQAHDLESLKQLREYVDGEESRREAQEKQNVLSWVSSKNVEVDHGTVRSKLGEHYYNSGQWFKTYYNQWIASLDHTTLWVTGAVGTGKSSLM
jgi:ppGpp synthetase/RelA/SpoT-type nucleotidyltranferase